MNRVNKYLGIANLILWTSLFISLFFIDYNILQLKHMCIGATFIVGMDVFLDMLGNGDKKTKRKVMLEYMANESDDKQGEE